MHIDYLKVDIGNMYYNKTWLKIMLVNINPVMEDYTKRTRMINYVRIKFYGNRIIKMFLSWNFFCKKPDYTMVIDSHMLEWKEGNAV